MTDWSSWNPEPPEGCPPQVWEKAVASARAFMADPDVPRPLCMTTEEALWQGRADGMALGERMPARLVDRMAALHRPYMSPDVEHDSAA